MIDDIYIPREIVEHIISYLPILHCHSVCEVMRDIEKGRIRDVGMRDVIGISDYHARRCCRHLYHLGMRELVIDIIGFLHMERGYLPVDIIYHIARIGENDVDIDLVTHICYESGGYPITPVCTHIVVQCIVNDNMVLLDKVIEYSIISHARRKMGDRSYPKSYMLRNKVSNLQSCTRWISYTTISVLVLLMVVSVLIVK
jgi:hypothetical protein